jgi:hypothetical protein
VRDFVFVPEKALNSLLAGNFRPNRGCGGRNLTDPGLADTHGAWFPAENVRIEGETKPFARAGDPGRESTCNFCPNCGTSIWWEGFPGKIGVAGGCFADPDFPRPTISIYEQLRHRWVHAPNCLERYEAMPPRERLQEL